MKKIFTILILVTISCIANATSVTIDHRISYYHATFNDGGSSFDNSTDEVGMWANTSSTSKQAVAWRAFKTAGDNTGSARSLQIGDKFTITVAATQAYGRIGCALLASPSTSTWADRESNYAVSFNLDGPKYLGGSSYGNWYIKYKSGATSATSFGGNQGSYTDFTFTFTLIAQDRANISISNGSTTTYFYDIELNTSSPITEYSIYLEDDWDGGANQNIYWKPTTSVENLGSITIGQSNSDYTISNAITNGLAANSTSTTSVNNLIKAGTGTVTLSAVNTYSGTTTINGGSLVINAANSINDLSIAASTSININAGKSLTVSGTLTNSAGNTGIVIKSDNTGTGALIHSSSVSGTVQNYNAGPSSATGFIHYLSMPVSSGTGATILDAAKGNFNAYYWNPASTSWVRVYSGDALTVGKGYYAAYNADKTISWQGTLNYTTVSSSLISSTNTDWNLVGNPFTAPVSANSFVNASNNPNINGTLKYWSDPDNAHTFASGDYASWTTSGGVAANGKTPGDYIPVGQGFFVESNGSGSTLNFNASWRSAQNPTYFEAPQEDYTRAWFTMKDANENYNEILLVFDESATTGFDRMYDSKKLRGNPNMAFYSLSADNDGNEYDIQGLPQIQSEFSVNLGYFMKENTTGSIALKHADLLDNYQIILEDKTNNTFTDLKKISEYEFISDAGEYNSRFILHFSELKSGLDENEGVNTLFAYNGSIYVNVQQSEHLYLYDAVGNLVYESLVKPAGLTSITLNQPKGIYFVKLGDNQNQIVKKIIL